jgi:hypothetical protein
MKGDQREPDRESSRQKRNELALELRYLAIRAYKLEVLAVDELFVASDLLLTREKGCQKALVAEVARN